MGRILSKEAYAMTAPDAGGVPAAGFSPERKAGVYEAIFERRDIRSQFLPDPVPDEVLARILRAAHHAPSVGFMQPWDFILIRDLEVRGRVKEAFLRANNHAAALFEASDASKVETYRGLKLEGILESPLNICVTCDRSRFGPVVIGRTSQRVMDLYSSVCAVQNLWLAARAEGLGVGWVSIVDTIDLKDILSLPANVEPVGYLCIGYVSEFPPRPELETAGWLPRLGLENVIRLESWASKLDGQWPSLTEALRPGFAAGAGSSVIPAKAGIHDSKTAKDGSAVLNPRFRGNGGDGSDREIERGAIEKIRGSIQAPCETSRQAAALRLDRLTKPQGSLGRLEDLAQRVVAMRRGDASLFRKKCVVVMAGDHGVVEEGVSAFPQEVTPQMVFNFLRGGAGINVLARHAGADVVVVDMGVAAEMPADAGLVSRRIASGTRNFTKGPAMTREEASRAVEAGFEIGQGLIDDGFDLIGTGDMGIGNTTPSAAITAVVTGREIHEVTGRGTGIDDAGMKNKVAAIRKGIEVNRPNGEDGLDLLSKVGGFEIGGLAGLILACAANGVPVVIDGFISGAAALVAAAIEPKAKDYMIAAHGSVERGHAAALAHLGLTPLLNLELRLGEGTGAALAFPLVEASLKIYNEMATFAAAGVSEKHG
jgi:nicotinate-nucleotide--dimethylbenzimidazole phosphoribosyltransferase